MESSQTEIKCTEPPIFAVLDTIVNKGYLLGNSAGCKEPRDEFNGNSKFVSILKVIKPSKKHYIFFRTPARVDYIGVLCLKSNPGKLSVYGRKYVSELENLAGDISLCTGQNITVTLQEERSKKGNERVLSGGSFYD